MKRPRETTFATAPGLFDSDVEDNTEDNDVSTPYLTRRQKYRRTHARLALATALLLVIGASLFSATSSSSKPRQQQLENHHHASILFRHAQQQQQQQMQRTLYNARQRDPRRRDGHRYHQQQHSNYYQFNNNNNNSSPIRTSTIHNKKSKKQLTDPYSHLQDVWFCLAMAVGWTVWMLSTFVKSDWARYQNDSVLVRGHVLQVSIEEDSLGTGIPTYKAVIDYMIENPVVAAAAAAGTGLDSSYPSLNHHHDGSSPETIQIRKHFETQHLLTEGFANVELLVLPTEPTHSVLREDYEQAVEEQYKEQEEMSIVMRGSFCKRVSTIFAAVLVMVSLAGSVQVVTKLDPLIRWKGWLILCVGVTLLLPAALVVHRALVAIQRTMEWQSNKAGIILRGATSSMKDFWDEAWDSGYLDPNLCDDSTDRGRMSIQRNPTNVTSTAGCYFVNMGNRRKQPLASPTMLPAHISSDLRRQVEASLENNDGELSRSQGSFASSVSSLSAPNSDSSSRRLANSSSSRSDKK